jgi:hypothetical protein
MYELQCSPKMQITIYQTISRLVFVLNETQNIQTNSLCMGIQEILNQFKNFKFRTHNQQEENIHRSF